MPIPKNLLSDRGASPTAWRRAVWLALLVAASIAFSLGFSCSVPFAAFGAVAALTIERREALMLIGAIWLANQLVGFGFLDYPWTADTFVWGFVLGAVAILCTIAARGAAGRFERRETIIAAVAAFVAAFVVYEGSLFVVSATLLGGLEDFVPAIMVRILEINAAAFVGLLILNRLGQATGFAGSPAARLSTAERHA
ncbi:MAG: hypothetical protein ACREFL_15025 [Stellaceae bacterium]